MAKPTDLSTLQPTLSIRSRIVLALTEANCFRGAEVTEQYLRLYSARLEKENTEYLFQALENLGEQVRTEGETSLLPLAVILQEIRVLTPRKKTAYEQECEEILTEQRKARGTIQ